METLTREQFINNLQDKKLAFGWYNDEFIAIPPEHFGKKYCATCDQYYASDEIDICDIPF